MDIAVLTMVHSEVAYFKQWLEHYEPQVGRENLYVLAHGGHEEILDLAQGCRIIFVPRLNVDWKFNRLRFRLINAYADTLVNQYDCVIAGDVDELVFADPDVAPNLRNLIERNVGKPILTPFGLHICEDETDKGFDPSLHVLQQRNTGLADAQYCKPLVVFAEPRWSIGYHACKHEPNLVEGLYMAHLRCAFQNISIEVRESRVETFDAFENLGNQSRQRFWGKHQLVCSRMYKTVKKLERVKLDDHIADMRAQLMSNVVSNYASRGGKSVQFIEKPNKLFILPERFSLCSV